MTIYTVDLNTFGQSWMLLEVPERYTDVVYQLLLGAHEEGLEPRLWPQRQRHKGEITFVDANGPLLTDLPLGADMGTHLLPLSDLEVDPSECRRRARTFTLIIRNAWFGPPLLHMMGAQPGGPPLTLNTSSPSMADSV